jgi:hypothetical protein
MWAKSDRVQVEAKDAGRHVERAREREDVVDKERGLKLKPQQTSTNTDALACS